MNFGKRGLLGGATTVVALGVIAAFGVAQALESKPMVAPKAPVADAAVLVAQAEVKATYTADQASRGKKVFDEDCAECHGKDLRGGLLGGPPLRGLAFEGKYGEGAPAGVLFEVMQGTMPPNAPGSLSATTYADIMAHILKTNRYKAGAELPSDVDALYELVIDK